MLQAQVDDSSHTLIMSMPDVLAYKTNLQTLNKQWIRTTLTGKISSNQVASTLIDFMETTQGNFLTLQDKLINALVAENCHKLVLELAGLSQVTIDILKRNLFERTADVGFLAADDDIVAFLQDTETGPDREAMRRRLRDYRNTYTVYDEIVIMDVDGVVRSHLDNTTTLTVCSAPLLRQALVTDEFVEFFGVSDIRPGKGESLIYAQRIVHPATGEPLGVLCLCFDFAGEMAGIYRKLLQQTHVIICILDEKGRVISTSKPAVIAPGTVLPMVLDSSYAVQRHAGESYIVKTTPTHGYQGFTGLPWFGHVMCPVAHAFSGDAIINQTSCGGMRESTLFSRTLKEIDDEAEEVLADLELVVLNGEVMASKHTISDSIHIRQEACALPPILRAIHEVGSRIRGVFSDSISSLLDVVISSRLADAQFFASLAIDIMDRNLYERANDCRWWALNSTFRAVLSRPAIQDEDQNTLRSILLQINSLYTVYTSLLLFDTHGRVIATSMPDPKAWIGRQLGGSHIDRCLALKDSSHYSVSEFAPFPEYPAEDGTPRHTYIYCAAVMHPTAPGLPVGGIGIVFDAEPQFRAMLDDSLLRDSEGTVLSGCSAFFVDKDRRIISSTDPHRHSGDIFPVDPSFTRRSQGDQCSDVVTIEGVQYVVGCAASDGYREYKRDGIYSNDVTALMLLRV